MKKLFVLLSLILCLSTVLAQDRPKVIMHLQSSDTLVYRSLVNQVSNMKKEIPDAEIAVICHGPGMDFLLREKSVYINRILRLNLSNVHFIGCEFTMKQRNISKDELVPAAVLVPFALVDIVKKQQNNWTYVKLGF